MARRKHYTKSQRILAFILFVVIVAVAVYGYTQGWFDEYLYPEKPPITDPNGNVDDDKPPVLATGELQIHFMQLGNKYTGDCIYIKAGETDILVDAGSRTNSSDDISNYVNNYCTDGILEYVIVTHADQDHIAAFAGDKSNTSLFDIYETKNIIQFALTNKTTAVYNNYVAKRNNEVAEGANLYTALDCCNETNGASKVYELTDSIKFEILYQKFYEEKSGDENEYSVCFMLTHGEKKFLFTGDLEEHGEASLVENNKAILADVEFFKAGHHGSKTSNTAELFAIAKPKIVVVTCVAGAPEYTDINENTFPTQIMIDNIAPYTNALYAPLVTADNEDEYEILNGDIVVTSDTDGVEVNCSNNNTKIFETEWFKENRIMPTAWIS